MKGVIRFSNCSADYGQGNVLKNVSLTVQEGETLVIIGSSGCGKTTLLKLVNGLLSPAEGEIFIKGKKMEEWDLISLRKRMGYVVQGAKLFPHMTVRDNICYVPSLERKLTAEEKNRLTSEMLELVQLPIELAERFPSQLSGGQQQRVGIARALAAHPEILLMDEPFGAVDEITRRDLQKQVLFLQQQMKITTLFVTHDIREACKMGNRIVVMKDGKILQIGTAEELRTNPGEDFVRQLMEE